MNRMGVVALPSDQHILIQKSDHWIYSHIWIHHTPATSINRPPCYDITHGSLSLLFKTTINFRHDRHWRYAFTFHCWCPSFSNQKCLWHHFEFSRQSGNRYGSIWYKLFHCNVRHIIGLKQPNWSHSSRMNSLVMYIPNTYTTDSINRQTHNSQSRSPLKTASCDKIIAGFAVSVQKMLYRSL